MTKDDLIKREAIKQLKLILSQTFPLCKDGNPLEHEFQIINAKTHQILWLVEQLAVKKIE